ncbi:hypothetical protein JOH51_001686 [Rhizobium leguminosarum]|nr:hypothetical protein [Rhizobium leguminosarum]
MISDQVTFCRDTANEIGVLFDIGTENEEGGRHAVFGEYVEYLSGAFWIGAVVER